MFYRLGENSGKHQRGSENHLHLPSSPSCTSGGLICLPVFCLSDVKKIPLPAHRGKLNCNVIKRAKAICQTI